MRPRYWLNAASVLRNDTAQQAVWYFWLASSECPYPSHPKPWTPEQAVSHTCKPLCAHVLWYGFRDLRFPEHLQFMASSL